MTTLKVFNNIIMSKIKFPTFQLLAPLIVLIVWNFSTGLTFTLDHWLLNMAQLIYMIRIGVQIAHLLSDLKGRLAIAITIQNIMLIIFRRISKEDIAKN